MSRLSIPESHLRTEPEPVQVPEEPRVVLTEAELEARLKEAEQVGYRRGAEDAEQRVRGAEREELQDYASSLDRRSAELDSAHADARTALRTLENRLAKYNEALDACLEAAAGAMAARLLMAAAESAEFVRDVTATLRERYRITRLTVSAPESMVEGLSKELDDVGPVEIEQAAAGEPLSIRLDTESGELRYSLREVAADLHRRLLEAADD